MKNRTRVGTIATAACIVLCGAVGPAAQRASTVDDRVRTAILAQERGWVLQPQPRRYPVDEALKNKKGPAEPRVFSQEWVRTPKRRPIIGIESAVRMTILYEQLDSRVDATAWLEKLRQSMPSVVLHQSLTDIGDQAIMYGPKPDSTDYTEIFFIKGKAKVGVGGPSGMIERIAKMVAAHIY